MKPSDWCKQKMQNAVDGEVAYDYFLLMELWLRRGL